MKALDKLYELAILLYKTPPAERVNAVQQQAQLEKSAKV